MSFYSNGIWSISIISTPVAFFDDSQCYSTNATGRSTVCLFDTRLLENNNNNNNHHRVLGHRTSSPASGVIHYAQYRLLLARLATQIYLYRPHVHHIRIHLPLCRLYHSGLDHRSPQPTSAPASATLGSSDSSAFISNIYRPLPIPVVPDSDSGRRRLACVDASSSLSIQ